MQADDRRSRLYSALCQNPSGSMEWFARAAGISRATLNREFTDRPTLVCTLLEEAMVDIEEQFKRTQRSSSLRLLVEALGARAERMRVLLVYEAELEADAANRERLRRLLDQLQQRIVQAAEVGEVRLTVSDAFAQRLVADLLWTIWCAVDAGDVAPNEAPELAWRQVLAALEA